MKLAIVLLTLILNCADLGLSSSPPNRQHPLWHTWKQVHSKQYDNEVEETRRSEIWNKAVQRIHEHNLKYDLGLESYRMGLNQFTDMTWDEFKHKYLGSMIEVDLSKVNNAVEPKVIDKTDIPERLDWREHNRVTAVKDQGHCGSCWAFSAAGAMEGQMSKLNGTIKDLSTQQLVDCSNDYGNHGCFGGLMNKAFQYAISYGMECDQDYSYRGRDGICKYNRKRTIFKIKSYHETVSGDEDDLLRVLYGDGPVSVGIDVTNDFMHYQSGVYISKICSSIYLNHGVLAIGYGIQNDHKYWLVKNSWGTKWGEQGYFKIGRQMNNMCGIATMASIPLTQ